MTQTPEQKRRRLPSLTREQFFALIEKGTTEFHNGGTRRRHVVGATFMHILYKGNPNSNRTSGVMRGDFIKWCKGYVSEDGKLMVWSEQGGEYITHDTEQSQEGTNAE